MTEDVTKEPNKVLRDLWREIIKVGDWPKKLGKPLWPIQYPEMKTGLSLFIGINPAYANEDKTDKKILLVRGDPAKDLDDPNRQDEIRKRDTKAIKGENGKLRRYFRWFEKASKGNNWNYVDLFAARHTGQAEIVEALTIAKDGTIQDAPFAEKQLAIALELITDLKPSVVTVVNALASRIIKNRIEQELKNEWKCDKATGFRIRKMGGVSTPWLLSGSVSGQGTMDNFSKCRLEWHIEQAMAWSQDHNK